MKLLELVLYQSCNYSCFHCPMKKWLYEADEIDDNGVRRNAITNDLLFEWLDKYLDPNEWFIEITGGEPSLYPEIKSLIPGLIRRGFHGLIRTNGSGLIPRLPSFPLVSAWHKDKSFPEYYDFILILENPEDDWKSKEEHCIKNEIPHVVFPFTNFGSNWDTTTHYPRKNSKYIIEMMTIFSSGAFTGCFVGTADLVDGLSLQKMSEPCPTRFCRTCTNVEAIEYFIDNIPGFLDHIKKDIGLELLSTELFDGDGNVNLDNFELLNLGFLEIEDYPVLHIDKWIDSNGNVVGVLGDDVVKINKKFEEDFLNTEEGRIKLQQWQDDKHKKFQEGQDLKKQEGLL